MWLLFLGKILEGYILNIIPIIGYFLIYSRLSKNYIIIMQGYKEYLEEMGLENLRGTMSSLSLYFVLICQFFGLMLIFQTIIDMNNSSQKLLEVIYNI